MMKMIKRGFVVAIGMALCTSPAAATPLSDLAESLEVGAFAELEIDGDVTTCQAMVPPSETREIPQLGTILQFGDEALWDPVAREIYIMAERRPYKREDQAFVRYSEATNSWTILPRPPFNPGFHAYDHAAIDPVRGIFYRVMTGTPRRVWRMDIPTGVWTEMPRLPNVSVQSSKDLSHFDRLWK